MVDWTIVPYCLCGNLLSTPGIYVNIKDGVSGSTLLTDVAVVHCGLIFKGLYMPAVLQHIEIHIHMCNDIQVSTHMAHLTYVSTRYGHGPSHFRTMATSLDSLLFHNR